MIPPLPDGPALRKLLELSGFLRFVLRRWAEDRCPQIAASLAFTTLLALVPVFAVAIATLSSAPFFEQAMVQVKVFLLLNLVPEIAGKIITVYMEQFAQNAARLTGVGLAGLFLTVLATVFTVDRSFNVIWRVKRRRPFWISVAGYLTLLALVPVLAGLGVTVTAAVIAFTAQMADVPGGAEVLAARAAPVLVSAGAFFLVYRVAPHRAVPWRHAALGGALAAVLFETMKELFGQYLRAVPTYNVIYGAFAAIPLFLVWIYLSWLVVLFGAEFTAACAYWRGGLWRRAESPGMRFRDALEVGRRLVEARGASVTVERLWRETAIPPDELEAMLEGLAARGIVRRVRRAAYALARTPDEVTLGDLYRAAFASAGAMSPQDWAAYTPELARVAAEMEAELGRPMAALGAGAREPPSGR